jgi:hypothetical protein
LSNTRWLAPTNGTTLPAINKDAVFDTPPPSVKPSTNKASTGKSFSYKSPDIKFEDGKVF